MKNVNILLALSIFSFLQSSFDAWVIRQPSSPSHAVIRQAADAFNEFLWCDLSCLPGNVSESVTDSKAGTNQANSGVGLCEWVCTRTGCTEAPDAKDLNPAVPAQLDILPSVLEESARPFEAPGMLAGLILES